MGLLRFVLGRVWPELVQSKHRSLLIVLCIAVGIAAVSGVQIYGDSLGRYYAANVKELTGGDLIVQSRRFTHEPFWETVGQWEKDGAVVTVVQTVGDVVVNLKRPTYNAMATIRSIDPLTYPLYGQVELASGRPLIDLLAPGTVVLSESVRDEIDVQVGDWVYIFGQEHQVVDILLEDAGMPDLDSQLFGKVIRASTREVMANPTEEEGLRMEMIQTEVRFRLPQGFEAEQAKAVLNELLPDGYRISTYHESAEQFSNIIGTVNDFTLILALSSLLLGGLGVANAVSVMVRFRLKELAIIKGIGGRKGQVLLLLISQVLVLGLVGIGLGLVLGVAVAGAIPGILGQLILMRPDLSLSLGVLLRVSLLGLAVVGLFSLLPILEAVRFRPLEIYRRLDGKGTGSRTDGFRRLVWVIVMILTFGGLVSWLIGNAMIGFGFTVGLAILTGLLLALIGFLLGLVSRFPAGKKAPGRLALSSIRTLKWRFASSVLALALGVGSIGLIALVQTNVLGSISAQLDDHDMYNVLIINPDPSRVRELSAFLEQHPDVHRHTEMAMYTGSITAIDGRPIAELDLSPAELMILRTIGAMELKPDDPLFGIKVAAGGRLFDPEALEVEVVLGQILAQRLDIGVGSRLQFEVAGESFEFLIVGIEENEGGVQIGVNSSLYLPPGFIDRGEAYADYIVMARTTPGRSGDALVREVRAQYRALLVVDIGQLMDLFYGMFNSISRFMQFLGVFSVIAGLIILSGTVLLSKWERRRELAIVRCLGGQTSDIITQYVLENGIAGAMAGLLGLGVATGATSLLTKHVLKTEFNAHIGLSSGVFFVLVLLSIAVGLLSIADVMKEKPLPVLRNE